MDMDAELAKLLHEQEQFMQSGKASSAKLHTAKPKVSPSPSQAAPLPPTIMRAQVMERSTPVKTMPMSTLPPTDGGFPSAKKTSLFGRRRNQQAARSESSSPVPSTARREPSSKSSSSPIPNDIQDDNNAAIANMSVEEIRQAQAELHASLPPEILDMFKKRRNFPAAAPPAVACSSSRPDLPPPSFQTLPIQNIPMLAPQTDESLRRAVSELPKEERLKHEWMQSLPPSHQQNQDPVSEKLAQQHEQRRVDLQGHAIKATADTVPLHSGLFHHGLEPELAGYTMEELLMLARSTVSSQRTMALSVLAKSIRAGTSEPTTATALVARSACEESNASVLAGGIDALHACLVGFDLMTDVDLVEWTPRDAQGRVHMVTYIDEDEVSDVKEIADPIQALLFTQFQSRLLQLIDPQQAPLVPKHARLQLLEIGVVIAMHSPRAAAQLLEGTAVFSLLNALLSVASVDSLVQNLEATATTLLWILRLCQADKAHAQQLMDHHVLASTKVFLAMRHPSALLPLQTLTMRIWRVCLSYKLDQPSIAYLFPLLCGYAAQALTQSVDSVPLEPWPAVMQDAIWDALVFLVDQSAAVAFLPFFIHQASQAAGPRASALRFLAATYPLVFTFPSLDVTPFVAVWPTLKLSMSDPPSLIEAIVAFQRVVAAHPHPKLQVDISDTVVFTQSYVSTGGTLFMPRADVATVLAALVDFVALSTSANDVADWARATAYQLLQHTQPGQHTSVRQLLRSVLVHPSLVAIYEALLNPHASNTKTWTCHTLVQSSSTPAAPSLPPPSDWVFMLASRLHSIDSKEESTVLRLLVEFLTTVETRHPTLLAEISPTDKILHLAHVYLWEADAWRDCSAGLHALLERYIREQQQGNSLMDATERIVAVQHQSVANLLSSLVQVFCNESYGDKGLAWILTLYFHPSQVSVATHSAVWNEIAQFQCLHLLQMVTDDLEGYVVDDVLLDAYLQSVLRQHLTADKGAAMYRWVVHHIGHFCFSGPVGSSRKHSMLRRLLEAPSTQLVRDVVLNPANETTTAMLAHVQDLPPFAAYRDTIQLLMSACT